MNFWGTLESPQHLVTPIGIMRVASPPQHGESNCFAFYNVTDF